TGLQQQVARVDLESGAVACHDFGPHGYVGEPFFIPTGAGEDDGVVVAMVFDAATEGSAVVGLDARGLAAQPLCSARLRPSVALDKGYFKKTGVDVASILTSKGGGTSVRNMMAGETLFAEVALPAALSAIKEGFPIKIISGGTDGPSSFWVTRPGEKIEKPEDLKGKR